MRYLLLLVVVCSNVSAQTLVVTSRSEHLISFVDLSTGKITASVETPRSPHEMIVDSAREFIYVPGYWTNQVAKIDIASRKVKEVFEFAGHRGLHGIEISKDGKLVWITSEEQRAVLEVDVRDGQVVKEWPTDSYKSHVVVSSKDDTKLYITNIDDGTVTIVDRIKGKRKIIKSGQGTEGIDILPKGDEVWITNRADNTISVIKTTEDRVSHSFQSKGAFPVKLKISPDGKQAWITNNRSSAVAVFEIESRELIKLIDVGKRPLGICFSDNGEFCYVSKPGENAVLEISTKNYSIVRRIEVPGSPDSMIYLNP